MSISACLFIHAAVVLTTEALYLSTSAVVYFSTHHCLYRYLTPHQAVRCAYRLYRVNPQYCVYVYVRMCVYVSVSVSTLVSEGFLIFVCVRVGEIF